jgi:hypothetical protein
MKKIKKMKTCGCNDLTMEKREEGKEEEKTID